MTEEKQRRLIKLGHLLIDNVEANINYMFDSIKRNNEIKKAEKGLEEYTKALK